MASISIAGDKLQSGAAHSSCLSHHLDMPLFTTSKTRNKHIGCRATSCLYITSPPRAGLFLRTLIPLLVVFLWCSLLGPVSAETHGDRSQLRAALVEDDLAWKGSSLFLDLRPQPVLMPPIPSNDEKASNTLSKRAVNTDPNASKGDFTIPQPLDTGLSNNFTSSCASFLARLRSNDAFKQCHPFSLMLQTSSSFFDATKSYLRITQTLDATCGVNATQCKKVMDDFARELMSATACKTDLANDNPMVIQTVNGLIAYPVAYQASCLRDNEGSYCFANAVTNTTATTDSLPYYLTVGQELPGSSRPTCNSCLQDAMAVFAQYSNNATQPISKTYATAAQQLSISCGRTFVNVTAAPLKGAATTTSASLTPQLTLFLMFILFIFQ